MIDTHTHLYLDEFAEGGSAAVERALDAGVSHLVMPNIDCASVAPLKALHSRYPAQITMAMGLHPTEVNHSWEEDLARLRPELAMNGVRAVGEVGMDLYWDKTFREQQMQVFERQLGWAREQDLPVIIHCREALPETLEVIKGMGAGLPSLIFHSFTGGIADVEAIRDVADAWFGINGVVTFKNAKALREALPVIGVQRLLLETDSPYLAPVPMRGRRNESSYLPYIAGAIASTLGKTLQEIDEATSANARQVFHLPAEGQTSCAT